MYFLLENGPIEQQNETGGTIRPPCHAKEPPTGMKSVSRHEEASAGGGSFAQQGEPHVMPLLPICHQGGSTKITGGP